jgi:transposase
MMGACDVNGFILESCEVIKTTGTEPESGTVNTDRFEMWLEQKLCPTLGRYGLGEPRSLVVMDNATIHHSDRIKMLIEDRGAKLVYLPPYSPDLNPIELFFGQYKIYLKRIRREYNWVVAHVLALQEAVTPEKARAFFLHCGLPLKPLLNEHDICKELEDEEEEEELAVIVLLLLSLKR